MKIENIKLENIRSHINSIIKFQDGFNCLVGGLGAGKSSILYAVDFALFGEPIGRSYDYLLRESANMAKITLKFTQNGKEFTIQRALKRQDEHISQDNEYLKLFEGEKLLAEMRSDALTEQLQSITGIDKEIFREVIWIQQEHLKDVLNMPPSERQRRLDQLFGLSDYETSWTNLRPIAKWYESESASLERDADIVGKVELGAKYDETVKDLLIKDSELEEAKIRLLESQKRLEEVTARLEQLEGIRRENEELRREEYNLQVRINGVEESIRRLAEETQRRETKIKELEERLNSLRRQEESHRESFHSIGLPSELPVEELRRHTETLLEQISSNLGSEENLRNEINRATQRVSNLIKENTCPLCLQVLVPDYKEKLIERLYQESAVKKQQLEELEKTTERLEKARNILNSAISSLQMVQTRIEDIAGQKLDEKTLLEAAQIQVKEKQDQKEVLKGQLDGFRLKIRSFDLTQLEEAQKARIDTFDQYSKLRYQAQSIELQKTEIIKRIDTLKESLVIAQGKAARLEKVKKIMDLAQEIRQAYRSIQPKLRGEFVIYLERIVQQMLDELTGAEGPIMSVDIDENYTPIVEGEGGIERSVLNLSGGERTLLAFAYRLGIGQLIMQWRVGHGLRMLLLDEPTESLGREDGSIDRLAESIARLKTIEQVIAVTHSDAFAEKADHVIRLEKQDNQSVASVER